jgi:hypothetical protein
MSTLGTKWIDELTALPPSDVASPNLTARTMASVRELIRGGTDFYKLVAEHNAAQAPPLPPVVIPSFFDYAGVQVYSWPNFDQNAAARAYAAGFRWIAGLEHEGINPPVPNGHVPPYKRAEWTNTGLKYVVYGYCKGDPAQVADAASANITATGAQAYIANAEADVPATFDRPFLMRLRTLQPNIPLALSCNPDDPRDWQAWIGAKATPVFQAYVNKNPAVTPAECAFKAQQHGWRASESKPCLGVFEGEGQTKVPAARYVQMLKDAGARGFSVWAGEFVGAGEWGVYAAGITAGVAAS